MKIKLGSRIKAWALGKLSDGDGAAPPVEHFHAPEMLPGVVDAETKMAMDADLSDVYRYANQAYGAHESFPGYPTLVMYAQIAEYRMLSEKTAMAMIRKWIKLRSEGDDDKTDRIGVINKELERMKVRELFGEVAKHDGWMGRCQLFVDLGVQDGPSLANALFMDKNVLFGKLRKFKLIEAMWTYPNDYSASNPMADDYYNPHTWFVMGQKVHSTRLLTFVGRPVPDMLKPAYNFGGMSMSQLARPYIENWLKTRTSVNKLLSNFSTSGIMTNMGNVLAGDDGEDLLYRAQMYTEMKDNQDLLLLDKETEEFFQFNAQLTTIDALQAQAQEHMASVGSMPLVVLLGVTPKGLNASSDGEIRIWYDHVHDMQETLFRDNLTKIIHLIQLSKFGDIDHDITFDFVSLWEQDEVELAANRKSDADAANIYVAMGSVSPEEVRKKLSTDEHSGYNGLDVDVMPEPQQDDPMEGVE